MKTFTHKFVEFMPERLDPNVIYVSLRFSLVSHQCACGCGEEVVTPLAPREWQLIFNGETVSLYPSIGNWNFACRSHYWIEQNQVIWAPKWQPKQSEENEVDQPDLKHLSVTDRLWEKLKWRRFTR